MRRLFDLAFDHHGDLGEVSAALGVSPRTLFKLISMLRGKGFARTVTLFSPPRRGLAVECMTLVRLKAHRPKAIADFEAACVDDPIVTCAVRICGPFDYQITTYHADLREADRWRRVIEAKAEVGRVIQKRVETVWGHQLPGLPLHAGEPLSPPGARRRGAH